MRSSRASLTFIFVTILLESMGLGVIIPVLPRLIEDFLGGSTERASAYFGGLVAVYALMQFLFAPLLGALSDRYGRRPILLFSLVGQGADYLIMAFAPNLGWLLVGRVLAGICGASFSTAQAYIADITVPEKRAQAFGLVGAAFGAGFILGPALGGLLGGTLGLRTPFLAAAGLAFLNAAYGVFILPESLPKANRRQPRLREANPFAVFAILKRYPQLGVAIGIFALYMLGGQVMPATWVLYTEYRFEWDTATTGWSLALVGLLLGLVQGGLIRFVIPRLGEVRTTVLGLLLAAAALLAMAFVTQTWMLFALMLPYALSGIGGPALQGIISAPVPANEQGQLQGATAGIMGLTEVIGPIFFTFVFAWGINGAVFGELPGVAFLAAGGITAAAMGVAWRFLRPSADLPTEQSPPTTAPPAGGASVGAP